MRVLFAVILLLLPALSHSGFTRQWLEAWRDSTMSRCASRSAPSTYDLQIYKAAKRYFAPQRRRYWCVLKSQMWAESDFRPDAVSQVGARGLAQFMPATWKEVSKKIGIFSSATDPAAAIKAQAWFMDHLANKWLSPRPEPCRIRLAAASYNAGLGNVIRAQRVANMAPCWDRIGPALPEVTGRHAKETRGYVSRIDRQYQLLTGEKL